MFKVLLVDDDAITLMMCKMVLQKASFSSDVASVLNGKQALEFFQEISSQNTVNSENGNQDRFIPDIVFLDLNMPVMGGWDFLDEYMNKFRPSFPDTKVVILSSTVDPDDYKKAKDYSVVYDFFSKPISVSILNDIKQRIQNA
ncbi:response regulator [Leptospira sp. GIMC2001]|uniref:response regulator n=1 Tax=Leptospira sp. GIMC2001 TaxID=1513297 RepID=UPI00234A243C|nr:response regulator [Leptospira sp. GIMC2001]WCL50198.1 response regulator [Leptospira sp. GIMC2001]